jgi:hypothetical protein
MNDIEKRFWSKVEIRTRQECWLWRAGKDKDGYGTFWILPQNQRAHRFAYETQFGPVDKNLFILHKCDNPSCVNPSHLFVGDAKDNIFDMMTKNRQNKGEQIKSSKLVANQVKEIKVWLSQGYSSGFLAKKFKVHKSTIKDIKAKRTWVHVN